MAVRSVLAPADATVLDAEVLYELETNAYFNVSRLFRFSMSSLAYTSGVMAGGCDIPDLSEGEHNYMAVRRVVDESTALCVSIVLL
jgi:hypothetical protein